VKIRLIGRERKSKTSIAISIAAHVALLAGLAAITFHYQIIFTSRPIPPEEHPIRYVRLVPEPAPGGGGAVRPQPPRSATRMTILAPRSIPVGVPQPASPKFVPKTGIAIGATENPGRDASPAAGVRPGIPDSRIVTDPVHAGHLLKTDAQKADSALSAIYQEYLDSVRYAQAHPQKDPRDWSWGGKNGDKWGWDPDGIHIGGITIPNAVLAALPLNMGPSGRNMNAITDGRADAYMRSDISLHANQMSEDDFKAKIQSIRDRKDRERQEKMAKRRKDPPDPTN
jgi:hypothetical protein